MKSAFPFRDPQTDYLHRKVVAEIQHSDYHFHLPYLNETSWSTICNNASERERLEFVGDALIGAFIAEELYKQRPNEGPGYYTIARIVLAANSTFAHLMHKAGLLVDLGRSVKPAGDAFETILAALHGEQGAKAFQTYARRCFLPLIDTVGLAYDTFRTNKAKQRKHKRMTLLKPTSPLVTSKRFMKGKRRAKDNKLRTTTLSPHSDLCKRIEPQPHPSTSIRTPVAIIDLTEESDTERDNGKIQDFRFRLFNKPDRVSDSNNSTARDSSNKTRDLLISMSTSSAVVSVRKDSESELNTSGEDAVQDDLVARFKNTSLLGTAHNPITID